jgi:hypothetical protein
MMVSIIKPEYMTDAKAPCFKTGESVLEVREVASLADLADLCLHETVCCAVTHHGIKNKTDLQSIQFVFFDFDDGTKSADVIAALQEYDAAFAVVGSMNHLKEKNPGEGIKERFHVFIPFDQPISDPDLHRFALLKIAEKRGWSIDRASTDVMRHFAKHSQIIHVQTGKPLNAKKWDQRKRAWDTAHPTKQLQRKAESVLTDENGKPILPAWVASACRSKLEGKSDRFATGSWHSAVCICFEQGLTEGQTYDFLDQWVHFSSHGRGSKLNPKGARDYIAWVFDNGASNG